MVYYNKRICIFLLCAGLILGMCTISAFSQTASDTITISKAVLEKIITDRVAIAVDEAVAIAVKDTELKSVDEITGLKLRIVGLEKERDYAIVERTDYKIKYENLQVMFDAMKKDSIGNYFLIGGISLVAGFAGGFVVYPLAVK